VVEEGEDDVKSRDSIARSSNQNLLRKGFGEEKEREKIEKPKIE
jgi:hypothetical protein